MKNRLTYLDRFLKRSFDIVFSLLGIIVFIIPIMVLYVVATIDTKSGGFFIQERAGLNGKPFKIIKIRTMVKNQTDHHVTAANDSRITKVGKFLRHYKLDELPQLFNIFLGHMSFVGPRPFMMDFCDELKGEDRMILTIRPGVTSPATLVFRHEETLLSKKNDPIRYHRDILYPKKVSINKKYIQNYTFSKDLLYIVKTVEKTLLHS